MQGSVAEQLQSHFTIPKPAEDDSKEVVQISFSDTSAGFVPVTPIPVGASCISHSYLVSLLGHVQFREKSQHTRRDKLLLGASLSCVQAGKTSKE